MINLTRILEIVRMTISFRQGQCRPRRRFPLFPLRAERFIALAGTVKWIFKVIQQHNIVALSMIVSMLYQVRIRILIANNREYCSALGASRNCRWL